MGRERTIGLLIDLAKFIVSIVVLGYAWYLLATLVKLGGDITTIVYLQETQQIYLYYMVLAIVGALYYIYNHIFNGDFAPSYTTLFEKTDLYLVMIFLSVYLLAYLVGIFNMGLPPILTVLYALPLSFVQGIMGIVENIFFIGTLGFGIRYLLRQRTEKADILASVIVGLIAVAWHLYTFLHVLTITGVLVNVFVVAFSVFIFFTIGSIISFRKDNTWVWDIVHFSVNFIVGLLGSRGFIIIW